MPFDGITYNRENDGNRLQAQLYQVKNLMLDGNWRTLAEIAKATDYPEPSVSARLRDLRKEKFGGYIVERRHKDNAPKRGLYEYRVACFKSILALEG